MFSSHLAFISFSSSLIPSHLLFSVTFGVLNLFHFVFLDGCFLVWSWSCRAWIHLSVTSSSWILFPLTTPVIVSKVVGGKLLELQRRGYQTGCSSTQILLPQVPTGRAAPSHFTTPSSQTTPWTHRDMYVLHMNRPSGDTAHNLQWCMLS